jgi:hypothetical protein
MPFNVSDINKRVIEVCKDMGILPVQGARVLAEFREAGLIESHVENGRNMMRFKFKIATLTEKFGLAISATMEPRFQFDEADKGDNDTTLASPKGWKGLNQRLFRRV